MPASPTAIKPTHKAIAAYYDTLRSYADLNQTHETGVRSAFQRLLEDTGKTHGWTLVAEVGQKVEGRTIRPDATLYKSAVPRGYWEAKDTADDLDAEIRKKIAKGYPLTNIIFEDTRQAVLYQGKQEAYRVPDLNDADALAYLLNTFYGYTEPVLDNYDQALTQFKQEVPRLAEGLVHLIENAHQNDKTFIAAFDTFFELCKTALNPNISRVAVDEMLVQHLLTERLIRKIFDNPEFTKRNVIAAEIEKVIAALVSHSFSREEFLMSLDTFYQAIEQTAHGLNFQQKQGLLNEVYERFFQGYSVKIADTHGIVYTPQPIVDFMCASVVEVLQTEFGKTLGDPDVVILDPATGTGNFIVNLLRRIPRRDLEHAYKERLFANEVMLLPYYIAALNIEHAYYDLTGQYESFEGLCFVDTLDIIEGVQGRFSFMTEKNTERVERQKKAPITVIIGNPPYNVGQQNENDKNKNRTYSEKDGVDTRIKETYVKDSNATLKTQLYDPYVRFFRWAADRLQGRDGIVCMVTNNGFLEGITFDGFRKHMNQDFNRIYVLDLKGNIRKDSMRDGIPLGEAHTVFGLAAMVGISITILVRNSRHQDRQLSYAAVDWRAKRTEKFQFLAQVKSISGIDWQLLAPDSRHTWITPENADDFALFLPIGSKTTKAVSGLNAEAIFKTYSSGVKTNRDDVVYDFSHDVLTTRMMQFVDDYNAEVDRFRRAKGITNVDEFIKYERIKWDGTLKQHLRDFKYGDFDASKVRISVYRPFTKRRLYFDRLFLNSIYQQHSFFPASLTDTENLAIAVTDLGSEKPFMTLMINTMTDLHLVGAGCGTQCFPFYVYDEDGSNRRENITDWALSQFRTHYGDDSITKWDIFYYVYGVLHHPGYQSLVAMPAPAARRPIIA